MKLGAYVRVSRVMGRDREGERFRSPGDQRNLIAHYAAAHGHEIVAWHEELDVSGGRMDRPEFARLMDRVRRGEVDGVIVSNIDRFARTVVGALDAVAELDTRDVAFIAVENGVDRSTHTGRLLFGFLLLLAEWHLDAARANWDRALSNAVEEGIWPAVTPFGYRKRDDGRLEPDPEEEHFLRGIFERRVQGETWARIAEWLNAEGVPPRRASQWTGSTAKDICRHEVYLGVIAKQGHRNEAAHEALVGLDLWHRAQNVQQLQPTKPTGDGYLGAGILRCAGCSYALTGSTYKRKGREAVRQYSCKRHHGTGDCPAPAAVNATVIEPFLERAFLAAVGVLELRSSVDAPELAAAEQEARDAQADLTRWATNREVAETFGEDAYLAGARKRRDRLDRALEELAEARRRATGVDVPPVVELRGAWPSLSRSARRRLIAAALGAVFVRRGRRLAIEERTKVFRRGEEPAGLPSKGRPAPIRTIDF